MSGDCMRFPDTVEEFMDQYKVVDKEGIYMSKGAKLVPIFRMEQWFEHEKVQLSQEGTTKDAISRQAALDAFGFSEKTRKYGGDHSGYNTMMLYEIQGILEGLPSTQPEEAIPVSWIESRIERFMMAGDAFTGLMASTIRVMLNEWKKEQEGGTT